MDKILLRKRSVIETVNDELKNIPKTGTDTDIINQQKADAKKDDKK